MSAVPSYEHDVFISYAWVDNQPVVPTDARSRWVDYFVDSLKTQLDRRLGRQGAADIWKDDRKLRGNDPLSADIRHAVTHTATLVVIFSEGYLASPWCEQERELFLGTGGTDRQRQVFMADLDGLPLDRRPEAFRDCLGFPFFQEEPDSSRDRIETAALSASEQRDFVKRVGKLAETIVDQLRLLQRHALDVDRGLQKERPAPVYPNQYVRELSTGLQTVLRKKRRFVIEGRDTSSLDAQILDFKRQLREGGRLQAGDFLCEDRFELLEKIGQGGFATVWKAYDESRAELVAVKVLHGQFSEDRTRRERFFRGARKMAELQHPGIVRVLEKELEDAGHYFFVMEYLPMGDLRAAVLAGQIDGEAGLQVILSVGEALAFAHRHDFIHRDVKPANILVDGKGNAKLTDFDLVQVADTTGGTRSQVGLGTFLYAAPEALKDASCATAQADVFSLGMSAVFTLYQQDLPPEVYRDVVDVLAEATVTASIKSVLVAATEWRVERRLESMEEFCGQLRAALDQESSVVEGAASAAEDSAISTPENSSLLDPASLRLQRTERRIISLHALLETMDEKIQALESQMVSETRAGEKFRLRQLIKEAREDREPLEEELDRLEKDLVVNPSSRFGSLSVQLTTSPAPSSVGMVSGQSAKQVQLLQTEVASQLRVQVVFRDELADGTQSPEMLVIPPGRFLMGSPEDELGRYDNERQHEVTIERPFAIGRHAVTFAEYDRFCEATQCEPPSDQGWGRNHRPVINVSWEDALAYCRWLSEQTGEEYRLPTEAEWEYTCRAGTTTAYWWKPKINPNLANYDGNNGETLPVGAFKPNPWGLYQVHGNVHEWTGSDWSSNYDGSELTQGKNRTDPRVFRGGAWDIRPRSCRAAFRNYVLPSVRNDNLGFRLASTL